MSYDRERKPCPVCKASYPNGDCKACCERQTQLELASLGLGGLQIDSDEVLQQAADEDRRRSDPDHLAWVRAKNCPICKGAGWLGNEPCSCQAQRFTREEA